MLYNQSKKAFRFSFEVGAVKRQRDDHAAYPPSKKRKIFSSAQSVGYWTKEIASRARGAARVHVPPQENAATCALVKKI